MALRDVFSAPAVAAAFDDDALLRAMVEFERALACAQAACGIVPIDAARIIGEACADARFDVVELTRAARRAGTLTIPFVKRLTEHVASRDADADADAMARNLSARRGFVYAEALSVALARRLGKQAAASRVEALVRRALANGSTLDAELDRDPELAALVTAGERKSLFDPRAQLGSAPRMIDRALAAWRAT